MNRLESEVEGPPLRRTHMGYGCLTLVRTLQAEFC